jgi:hypothetical protein
MVVDELARMAFKQTLFVRRNGNSTRGVMMCHDVLFDVKNGVVVRRTHGHAPKDRTKDGRSWSERIDRGTKSIVMFTNKSPSRRNQRLEGRH